MDSRQVEYMGSHDSLGADFVDLFVSDRIATPPEYGQSFFAEKILLTPHSFFMNEYARSRAHIPPVADAVSAGRVKGATATVVMPHDGSSVTVDVRREANGLPASGFLLSNFNQVEQLAVPAALLSASCGGWRQACLGSQRRKMEHARACSIVGVLFRVQSCGRGFRVCGFGSQRG